MGSGAVLIILIHTSVKLVTESMGTSVAEVMILIHTSVKLVTRFADLSDQFKAF